MTELILQNIFLCQKWNWQCNPSTPQNYLAKAVARWTSKKNPKRIKPNMQLQQRSSWTLQHFNTQLIQQNRDIQMKDGTDRENQAA